MTNAQPALLPRPGLLIIGRKRPGFDQEWGVHLETTALTTLEQLGFGAVVKARAVDDASLREALDQLRAAGVTALVVGQPTIGDGRLAPSIGRLWKDPVVLWATPERPGATKVTACGLVGQHLFASQLRQLQLPFEVVYGASEAATTRAALAQALRLVHAVGAVRRCQVGLIGAPVPGFANLQVDPARLGAHLGARLVQLGLHEFVDLVKTFDATRVQEETERIRSLQLPAEDGLGTAELAIDARYSLAVEEIMAAHGLSALAVRCWPELPDVIGQWPYLAFARLNTAHRAVALEGDADAALGAFISELLGPGPSFITDWLSHDENSITAWHPGMAPFQLCPPAGAPGAPRLTRHFNNRKPLCVDAELCAGMDVTLFRLWSCDGRYHLTAVEAHTARPAPALAGNSAVLRLDRSVPRWFDEMCHAGMPHHLSIAEGRHAELFRRFARLLDLSFFP